MLELRGYGAGWRAFAAIGFLGAFTTFSTFGYETAMLVQQREWSRVFLYAGGSSVGGLTAVFIGLALAAAITR